MGGNNSRLINPNGGDVLPAKIRPLLGQRFEEFRKRRNNVQGVDEALSKKQLLKDNDGSSDGQSCDQNEVLEETQPQKEQQTIREVAVDKLSQVVPLPVSECGNEEEKKEKEEEVCKGKKDHDRKIDKDVEKKTCEVKSPNAKHDEEEEEEEESDEEDEDDIGRRIGPGSPSFKIYCVESDEKKEQEVHDSTQAGSQHILEKEDQNIAVYNKSHSTDSEEESEASESENPSNSNEIVKETTPKKKGHHKRKKLEAMKKNLLNVKNLQKNRMNRMMGCAGNDRRNLLSDN